MIDLLYDVLLFIPSQVHISSLKLLMVRVFYIIKISKHYQWWLSHQNWLLNIYQHTTDLEIIVCFVISPLSFSPLVFNSKFPFQEEKPRVGSSFKNSWDNRSGIKEMGTRVGCKWFVDSSVKCLSLALLPGEPLSTVKNFGQSRESFFVCFVYLFVLQQQKNSFIGRESKETVHFHTWKSAQTRERWLKGRKEVLGRQSPKGLWRKHCLSLRYPSSRSILMATEDSKIKWFPCWQLRKIILPHFQP